MGIIRNFDGGNGHLYGVSNDVLGIVDRIKNGDAVAGWEGDAAMKVFFNQVTKQYELWRQGPDYKDHLIRSWAPAEFDARVLLWLVQHDSQKVDVLARVEKQNDDMYRKHAERLDDLEDEANKFVAWARKKLFLD